MIDNEKKSILYVDDESLNLMLFQENFNAQFKVYTALNAPEGLQFLIQNPTIDIVISDFKMPEMNGLEFVKKAYSQYGKIDYYILTGYEINLDIRKAIDTGLLKACFRKPFNIDKISKTLLNNAS